MSGKITKKQLQKAAAKALLERLLEIMTYDEDLKCYVLPDGPTIKCDQAIYQFASEFLFSKN